jgi:hypothetical protein
MDNNNLLYGSVILGLLGLVIFFYLLEVTIIQALKKFKKWEQDENAKSSK